MVAEGSAEQQQRGQREQIGVDHPLHLLRAGAVALAYGWQRDAEDGALDEGQAGGEDAGDEGPARIGPRPAPPARVARAQSTRSAIAAWTMLRHMPTSPTAACASSGSRIVWSTASAWLTCSRQARSTFSPADGSLPSALLLSADPASTRATRSTSGRLDSGILSFLRSPSQPAPLVSVSESAGGRPASFRAACTSSTGSMAT